MSLSGSIRPTETTVRVPGGGVACGGTARPLWTTWILPGCTPRPSSQRALAAVTGETTSAIAYAAHARPRDRRVLMNRAPGEVPLRAPAR